MSGPGTFGMGANPFGGTNKKPKEKKPCVRACAFILFRLCLNNRGILCVLCLGCVCVCVCVCMCVCVCVCVCSFFFAEAYFVSCASVDVQPRHSLRIMSRLLQQPRHSFCIVFGCVFQRRHRQPPICSVAALKHCKCV